MYDGLLPRSQPFRFPSRPKGIAGARPRTLSMIMMDSMQQMLPDEIETVSREVAREEGIKLFKEFSENLQNLRKAEE